MIAKIKAWFLSPTGLQAPHIYDHASQQPSFRLLCAYVTFLLAVCSVVALHFFEVSIATWTAIGLYSLSMVFYMLKRLVKAKIDLDDKSIELESEEKD
jgi:hypothetical protein